MTYDDRYKPDIIAPGMYVMSADANTSDVESCAIANMEGTSMATPIVAGTAALVREYFEGGTVRWAWATGPTWVTLRGVLYVHTTSTTDPPNHQPPTTNHQPPTTTHHPPPASDCCLPALEQTHATTLAPIHPLARTRINARSSRAVHNVRPLEPYARATRARVHHHGGAGRRGTARCSRRSRASDC